jgi:rhamnosyltransferase
MKQKVALIILTSNPGDLLDRQILAIKAQNIGCEILFIDSSDNDLAAQRIMAEGYQCHRIKKSEFNHGGTRKLATSLLDADFYCFLTQDAIFADNFSLENLLRAFSDPKIGCAYGRQLPWPNSSLLARHARLFNYPEKSLVKSFENRKILGIKTCFNSDSFSCYRKEALLAVDNFPEKIIFGEDMYLAAKMLILGWKVAYQADAKVYHSHDFSLIEEFKRSFKIGIFHAQNRWIFEQFNSAYGEGWKFLQSEWNFCLQNKSYFSLLRSFLAAPIKLLGFYLGLIKR